MPLQKAGVLPEIQDLGCSNASSLAEKINLLCSEVCWEGWASEQTLPSFLQDQRSRDLLEALSICHFGSEKEINLPVVRQGFRALLFLFSPLWTSATDFHPGRKVSFSSGCASWRPHPMGSSSCTPLTVQEEYNELKQSRTNYKNSSTTSPKQKNSFKSTNSLFKMKLYSLWVKCCFPSKSILQKSSNTNFLVPSLSEFTHRHLTFFGKQWGHESKLETPFCLKHCLEDSP